MIGAAHFFHDLYSHFLSPVLPLIIQNLGITYSQAGLLSIFHRFPSLFNPVIGRYASGKPTVIILSLSILVTAVSMSFITVAPSYLILSGLILTMGISACFFHIPAPVMIKKYSGTKIGTGMSIFMFGGEMARSIGPLAVLAAIALWGPSRVYFLIPLGMIMSILLLLKFREDYQKQNIASTALKIEDSFLSVFLKMKSFFIPVLMIMISRAFIASVLNSFLPAYLTSKGISLWFAGISLSIMQISAAAGTILAGPISDKFGKNNTLLAITLFSPVLMFLFIFSGSYFTIILLVITGFVTFASAPVVLAYVQHSSGENPTVCSSIYMMIDFMTISASLIFAGIASDLFGLQNAFLICGLISCIGFPFVLIIRKNDVKQS